jgi:hypothetical protein
VQYVSRLGSDRKLGLRLVYVENSRIGTRVEAPSFDRIPHNRLIVQVLNQALIKRFHLDVNFSTEGGVEGVWRKQGVRYQNWGVDDDGSLGLVREDTQLPIIPAEVAIQSWYCSILRLLFTEHLRFGRRDYGVASILKLGVDSPDSRSDAQTLLWTALARKETRSFANEVLQESRNCLTHLAGLTSEDIARMYVPLPSFMLSGDTE